VDVPLYAFLFAAIVYVFGLACWALLWLVFGLTFAWVSPPLFNPSQWSSLVLFGLGGLALIVGLIAAATLFFRTQDFNYYFNDVDVELLHYEKVDKYAFARTIPVSALSVNAGVFDEALMALSAAPIVYGLLYPRLNELIAPPRFWSMQANREYFSLASKFVRWVAVAFLRVATFPLLPFRKFGIRLLNATILASGRIRRIRSVLQGIWATQSDHNKFGRKYALDRRGAMERNQFALARFS